MSIRRTTLPSRRHHHPPSEPMNATRTDPLPPTLLLHPDDNILVARRDIAAGERVELDGETMLIPKAIELGHKLARRDIAAEAQVLKYGAPIGSMKTAVARGEHVHVHNLRSDYVSSTTRDDTEGHR
jgi:(2R)-sulfolactate sulfo-lyase subunit alpha